MWPSNQVLGNQVVGDAVNTQTVATADTGSDGSFTVLLPDPTVLTQGEDNQGFVNFSLLTSVDGQAVADYAFSRRVITTSLLGITYEAIADPSAAVSDIVSSLLSTLNLLTITPVSGLTISLGANGDIGTGAIGSASPAASSPDVDTSVPEVDTSVEGAFPKTCQTTLVNDYGNHVALVNAAGSSFSGVSQDFTYTQGASSTIGVAISATGGPGTFKVSGTQTNSTTFSEDFPAENAGYFGRRTYEHFRVYKYFCYSTRVSETYYETRSTWAGGATTVQYTGAPNTPYCVPQQAGSTATSGTSSAITWTDGLTVKGVIGIDLSMKTGFSTEATNRFHYNNAGRLCGQYSNPAETPGLLYAKAPA